MPLGIHVQYTYRFPLLSWRSRRSGHSRSSCAGGTALWRQKQKHQEVQTCHSRMGILRNVNADMNLPPVASLAVSPNTGRQKRERSQVSALLWYHVRLTAPPVKPCNMNTMQNKGLPFCIHQSTVMLP